MDREERKLASEARRNELAAILQPGDIITHTVWNHLQEHLFTGFDGGWICGIDTPDTANLEGADTPTETNDIAPLSVTHINRLPVDQMLDAETREILDHHITQVRARIKARYSAWQELANEG